MALLPDSIESISRQVYQKFPELKGTRPAVQGQAGAKAPGTGLGQFVLIFRGEGRGPGGQAIPRIVRVVADERGKVLKISTSR